MQPLTLYTPGAHNTECFVFVGGTKYIFIPPETRMISKSDKDMVIDCYAPGNRKKKVVISPTIAKSAYYNVGTGMVPGLAWDHASKAMYVFPDVVEVDFSLSETKPFPLPAQNQPDIRQPEDYDLEEFSPGRPRLNEDKYKMPVKIRKRQPPAGLGLYSDKSEEGSFGSNPANDPGMQTYGETEFESNERKTGPDISLDHELLWKTKPEQTKSGSSDIDRVINKTAEGSSKTPGTSSLEDSDSAAEPSDVEQETGEGPIKLIPDE